MRKLICLAMFLCLSIVVFSGCNISGNTGQNSNNSVESSITDNSEIEIPKDIEVGGTKGYRIEQVDFEIATRCFFLPGTSFGTFCYNRKYGIINSDGHVVVEPIYTSLSQPSEDHLIGEKSDGTFVVLTTNGDEVGKIEYSKGELEITIVISDESECQFSNGLAFIDIKNQANSDIKSICIDTNGKVVFESKYELVGKFIDGVAIGIDEETENPNVIDIVGIDTNGDEIWRQPTCRFGMQCVVRDIKIKDNIVVYKSTDTGLWGAIDTEGNEVLDCKYEELTYAGDGKIGFKKYGLWGYIDYDQNVVIEPQFSKAYDFIGGVALVCDDGGINTFIDEDGNKLFDVSDGSISYFENGTIRDNGKILTHSGEVLYETDVSQNGMGGTANGLSYSGGEIFYECLRGEGVSYDKGTYNYFKIIPV